MECNQLAKDLAGDKWTLGELKGPSIDDFWDWLKTDGVVYDGDAYLGLEIFVNFEKELWFESGNSMWRKHQSVFQDPLKYTRNDIVKPFRVGILHYTERVEDMQDLAKHLPPHLVKGDIFEADNWRVRNK